MEEKITRPRGLNDKRCKDLTGQMFGKLTAISIDTQRLERRVTWICKCECGNIKSITANCLLNGRHKSCGCKHNKPGTDSPNWKGYGELSKTQWTRYRNHAKIIEVPFSISIEDMWALFLRQERKCSLSGLSLHFPSTRNNTDGNASLDRIDSSKGYEMGNIQWIDKRFNWMKKDYDMDEFIRLCDLVSKYNDANRNIKKITH